MSEHPYAVVSVGGLRGRLGIGRFRGRGGLFSDWVVGLLGWSAKRACRGVCGAGMVE